MKNVKILTPVKNQVTKEYNYSAIEHSHTDWEITIFIAGDNVNRINGIDYPAPPNRVFILGPNHRHKILYNGTVHNHRDIYIKKDRLELIIKTFFDEYLCDAINSETPVFFDLNQELADNILKQLKGIDAFSKLAATYEKTRQAADSIIVFILGMAVESHIKAQTPIPDLFLDFLRKIQSPDVFRMRISDIKKMVGYSHTQLSFLFKKYTHSTLINYLSKLRLEFGEHLLRNTDKEVLDISYEIGYDSVSYFIKSFTKHYGITPLQFRKHSRAPNLTPILQ